MLILYTHTIRKHQTYFYATYWTDGLFDYVDHVYPVYGGIVFQQVLTVIGFVSAVLIVVTIA
jgi:hypothetical protein